MHLFPKFHQLATLFAASFLLASCHPGENANGQTMLVANTPENKFADYWYAGEAEVSSYELQQSRYGEIRAGEAIMVFVTEDFSKNKQVKLDSPEKAGNDKIRILKMNYLRRFVTGIYDYSMMQSVFTPVDTEKNPHSVKATTSSQDWCGHSFVQLNLEGNKYKTSQFSYFEKEGDQAHKFETDLLEDEIWNRIRINPGSLKEGVYHIIPSGFYSRLAHDPLSPKQARITFDKQADATFLVLEYLHLDRTLTIGFAPSFPHKILSWTEMQDGKLMSKGKLRATMKSAYWRQHDNQHEFLRDSLGI